MEEPFKNREILEMFQDVKKDLTDIKEQTTKTNGRVTSLELKQSEQKGFYKALTISGSLGWVVAMSMIGWMLTQILETGNQIQSLNAKLSAYEITIE